MERRTRQEKLKETVTFKTNKDMTDDMDTVWRGLDYFSRSEWIREVLRYEIEDFKTEQREREKK